MRRMLRTCGSVLIALVAAGCTVDTGAKGPDPSTSSPSGSPAGLPVLDGREVLTAMRGSLALVETPLGSGSSVLLADGYLVTNAHVVDPYDVVDVTFEGEEPLRDVEVVGVDLSADIAVLGPIDVERAPVEIVDPVSLEQGSDVYLVGFPGDQREVEVTIASGVLSRRRTAEEWDLDFLQSDATIGAGQSGGALVDDRGRVVGISGMRDENDFALSLAGGDVLSSVEAIKDGDGSDWSTLIDGEPVSELSVRPNSFGEATLLYLPVADEPRELTVTLSDPSAAVAIGDPGAHQYPWAANEAAIAVSETDDGYWFEGAEEVEPTSDGAITFDLERGLDAIVMVLAASEPVDVAISEPVLELALDGYGGRLVVGEPRTVSLGYFDQTRYFELQLEAGQPVEIAARSATGDAVWYVELDDYDLDPDDSAEADDGGGGLFDLDAVATFTPERTATYYLFVEECSAAPVDVRITVTPQ